MVLRHATMSNNLSNYMLYSQIQIFQCAYKVGVPLIRKLSVKLQHS